MNSQDLRNLQEAYMNVYQQLDELTPATHRNIERLVTKREKDARKAEDRTGHKFTPEYKKYFRTLKLGKVRSKFDHPASRSVEPASTNEETDLYDVILSHLIDEGYAETQEQAEVIMVNMSEEWRQSILSEAILEYQPFKDKRKRVKSKVKKLESQKSEDPKDLGFRNARLQKRINSMKTVLGKKNKEITSASQQKSYDSMAKGGFKHHDDPQSKYYIK